MNQLIGIYSSVPSSGKSEVAKILCSQGYIIVPFARPLKEISVRFLQATTGITEKLARKYIYDRKEHQIPGLPTGITGRVIQQKLGTDFARNQIDSNIWINAWQLEVALHGNMFCIVADDMRFENEAGLIRSMGGQLWLITRPGNNNAQESNHESDGRLGHFDFDVHIVNDGDLDDLRKAVLKELVAQK